MMNAPAKMESQVTKIKPPANVYGKIAAITGALAKEGIGKTRSANFGKFRGIDDVYNALAPLLSDYRLSIMPRMVARDVVERRSAKGNALFYTTVEAEFDFVSADDGSTHMVRTYGEAMDTGDKATNKAMSAAYKYAAFMTFCIPTEGNSDIEAATHEVSAAMPDDVRARIIQLCEAVGGNQAAAICAAYNVASIAELTPAQADSVIDRLNEKLAAKAKEKTNA